MLKHPDKVFSPNSAIEVAIKEMLPHFSEVSQRRMKKAICDAGRAARKHGDENTDASARHIFREFIPAFVLNRRGYRLEYEERIGGKTPDWLDLTSGLLIESYTYERGGTSSFLDRVKTAVATKCATYRELVTTHSLRLVVSVYLDFLTCMLLEECYEERAEFRATFDDNKSLWGVLFFAEQQPGIPVAGQPYDFLCLTADSEFERMPNWNLPSLCVYN
jgi:hypothetical protein